jgi:hypothetical protein
MLLYGATVFLSAFLLFLIQPLIGKYLLPWFGGTPAVWTTCMLFFQALLLGGYTYAHMLSGRWSLRRQGQLHIFLLCATILAILCFSIVPSPAWKPMGNQSPIAGILGLLLVSIGAPYLVLSSTSPLLQVWFSRTHPGFSPYRLYALSNLGSLLAILGYPFLIEPELTLSLQASLWSWAYIIFGLMCALISWKATIAFAPTPVAGKPGECEIPADGPKPGAGRYWLWLSLATCSSIMLLATTSMMCQDVAVVPLLWIVPLALYLLSFIITFEFERLYWRPLFVGGMAASIAWSCHVLFGGIYVALTWQILSYSLTLFFCCMVCHGELVRLKPGARDLTAFYLMIAGGGTLGGLLTTVAAPRLLKNFWEYHFGLLATTLLTIIVLFIDRKGPLYRGRPWQIWTIWGVLCSSWIALEYLEIEQIWHSRGFYLELAILLLFTLSILLHDRKGKSYGGRPLRVWALWGGMAASWIVLAVALSHNIRKSVEDSVATRRSFFGVLRILELNSSDPGEHRYTLMHGRIEHGFQYLDPDKRRWPTSYYGNDSGVGLAIRFHPRRIDHKDLRIGVIGLGTGTLAAQGQLGDYIRFYEINPEVLRISDEFFTYRRDSPARIEVVLGDARVSMERERQLGKSQDFDVLAVDAFSSDAIPVHLLTRECFQIYRYHLRPDGILAIHISNRYFDLSPVVRNLIAPGSQPDKQALWIDARGVESEGTDSTDWVLLTANREFLANQTIRKVVSPWPDPAPPSKVWTDNYSNLFNLLRPRKDDNP